jgi:hypothetical protein
MEKGSATLQMDPSTRDSSPTDLCQDMAPIKRANLYITAVFMTEPQMEKEPNRTKLRNTNSLALFSMD